MADKARQWTDTELTRIEKRIKSIYQEALVDISEKWNAYMQEIGKQLKPLEEAYEKALKNNDLKEIKQLKKELKNAKMLATLHNIRYTTMIEATANKLTNTNQIAIDYMNGKTPEIYVNNYNGIADSLEGLYTDFRFDLVNEDVVKKLIIDGDIELPPKKISIPKDKLWNTRKMNDSVLQGILQGESMDKIANRIFPIVNNNYNSAIRNARTMVTGAENRGRLDSYKKLSDNGIVMRKVWLATNDHRTRDSHRAINGEEQEIGKNFSNGLECPGDPHGRPEEVWNCRCTLVTHLIGFRRADGSISYVKGEEGEELGTQENRIIENNGFSTTQINEFFHGKGYIRFGEYSKNEKSIDFTRLTSEQREDINDIIEYSSDEIVDLEKKIKFYIENTRTWKNVDYDAIFEEGVSVFKSLNGLPVLENLTQAQSMAVRLDKKCFAVDGTIIGKGHDDEPLLKNTVNMQVSFDREQMENVIINALKDNFEIVEGKIEHGSDKIYDFYDFKTNESSFVYCGLTFKNPKNKKWSDFKF